MRLSLLLSSVLALAFVGGCSSSESTPNGSTGAASGGKAVKVGVVFDSGGRGDKSFNDSAWAGIEKAKQDLGIEVSAVDSKAAKDYEGNLSALADKGLDVIFAVGITQQDALKAVAPKYPKVHFAIVDGEVDAPNVRNLKFKEEQGSYVAGYLAGLMTKTNKIGFVGGMNIPLIGKFEAGYEAGAKAANPKVEALPGKFTESWDDVALGKAAASTLFQQGADIVYHAAGRCGLGVIDAAKEAGKFAIGVDSDQDFVAPGHVLTSMVKHVDVAVYETVKDVKEGKFTNGTKLFDLSDGGVGISELKYTKQLIGEANLKKLQDVQKQIVDGSLKVPTARG